MNADEAVHEVGWVAREARELVAAMPADDSAARAVWDQRWAVFTARKSALLAHIETSNSHT